MTGVTKEEVEDAADKDEPEVPATEEVDEESELPSKELLPVLPELRIEFPL